MRKKCALQSIKDTWAQYELKEVVFTLGFSWEHTHGGN